MDASPQPRTLSEDEEAQIRDSLKRCPQETVDAAVAFRRDGRTEHVPLIIMGIIARFLEPEQRPKLAEGGTEMRFVDDLGIDSLTMVEIVMLIEQTLEISIDNEELRDLRTVGDANAFIEYKLKGMPMPEKPLNLSVGEILEIMPHHHPFLFLQDASLKREEAKGSYKIAGDEFVLQGHFPNRPVFPASIMLEALGQLAVLYILKGEHPDLPSPVDPETIYFTSADGVRCSRFCKPGDVLALQVKPKRIRAPLASFEGAITCGKDRVAFVEEIVLTLGGEGEADAIRA